MVLPLSQRDSVDSSESRNFGKVWQTTETAEHLQINGQSLWVENNEITRQKENEAEQKKPLKKWETTCMLQKKENVKAVGHVGNRRNRDNLV